MADTGPRAQATLSTRCLETVSDSPAEDMEREGEETERGVMDGARAWEEGFGSQWKQSQKSTQYKRRQNATIGKTAVWLKVRQVVSSNEQNNTHTAKDFTTRTSRRPSTAAFAATADILPLQTHKSCRPRLFFFLFLKPGLSAR